MSEIDAYDYELPAELIAQQPLRRRSDARLLLVDRARQSLDHYHVRDLPELLDPRDALVLNDTRVIPARLVGYRTRTGGRWSGLFLAAAADGTWQLMSKTRGKLQAGEEVTLLDRVGVDGPQLTMLANLGEGLWAARPDTAEAPLELLERVGRVPLPPYIRGGEMRVEDVEQYQTVYAEQPGAVAAPTAGLHLTRTLLDQLAGQGVAVCRVTLHVGHGTFRPISAERLADHHLHAEGGRITAETAEALNARRRLGGRIVAVGSTSLRLLETAARDGRLQGWSGETELFIRPPYRFQATDALLTNFHLPKSSLLVLVRTFGGDQLLRRAYQAAIDERYRFYSYGDAMLIV